MPLQLEGSVRIDAAKVLEVLDLMDFRVRFGATQIVSFKDWWQSNRREAKPEGFSIQSEGVVLEYNGLWLRYEFARSCPIEQEYTPVSLYEKTYVSAEDRCYSLMVRHPTHKMQVKFDIEIDGWSVRPPVVSATLYQKGRQAVQIEQNRQQACSLTIPGWTFPGLAVVVEWTKNS